MDKEARIPAEFWQYLLATSVIGGGLGGGAYGLYSMMRDLHNERRLGKLKHRQQIGMPINLLNAKPVNVKESVWDIPWHEYGIVGQAKKMFQDPSDTDYETLAPIGSTEIPNSWDVIKPLAMGGGAGLGLLSFLAMRKMFERKKEQDIKRDVARARASFQNALSGKVAHDIAALRKESTEKKAITEGRGVIPYAITGLSAMGGIGALLGYLYAKGKLEKGDPELNELKQLRRLQKRRAAINSPLPRVSIQEFDGNLVPSI